MAHRNVKHRTRSARGVTARLASVALIATALVGTSVSPAQAATATVGNGLTTTSLAAVGMSPTSLASALVGPGVTVSNVSYTGANAQAGTIHVVDPAVVSFNDGVILSSGDIADVVGPNKSDGITGDMAGPADADLNTLIANTQTVNPMTYDATTLSFDFVPTASPIYFTYTFGSDEYLEWVNLFNDVFGFFVNGQNCATTPGGDSVSIDTINSTVNPQLFRDNAYWSPPANPINIESDGLSVELICTAPVNVGVTNHMKLALADTSDQILDSVVMIKSGSLSTTKPESCNDAVDNNDDTLIDDADPYCQATTTPPPTGGGGIGSGGNGPPFTGNEGTPIILDASALGWVASADAINATWTVTGINGTPGNCSVDPVGPQPIIGGVIPVADTVCPNEGEYVAKVEGWDIESKSAFDMDVDFFVHNAPPAVTLDTPTAGTQITLGNPVAVSASVIDPGVADTVTCSIDWGDGTTEPGALANDTCTGSHTYASLGSQVVAVTATDDAGDSSAAATVVDVVVGGTTVTSGVNPSVKGQGVKLTATTTVGTTGTMAFYDGTTLLGTKTVAAGTAILTPTKLAVGSHSITAAFQETPASIPSLSTELVQQVDAASTATTLTSSATPSVLGQAVTVKATVKALAPGSGGPTGTVSLYDGATLVKAKALGFAATASFTVVPTLGTHTYTAVYGGSSSYLGSSTATALAQVVAPAATATTIVSTVNPSVSGQYVTIKAPVKVVAPGTGLPTGTVSFYDGESLVATKTLLLGVAAIAVKPATGTHSYTAVFNGSTAFLGSTTAAPLVQSVGAASTTVTLSSGYPTTTLGHTGNVAATVAVVAPGKGVPTGTVAFSEGSTLLGTYPVVSGKARLPIASLAVGVHVITADYSGDTSTAPSSSTTAFTQTII